MGIPQLVGSHLRHPHAFIQGMIGLSKAVEYQQVFVQDGDY